MSKKGFAHKTDFFSFDLNINIESIIEVVSEIQKVFFDEGKLRISIGNNEETYNDISYDELRDLYSTFFPYINNLTFNLSGNSTMFQLSFQFRNKFTKANGGNYTMYLGSVENNNKAETILRKHLDLQEPKSLLTDEQMTVSPLFSSRDFKVKEKYCFVLMPFTEDWSGRVYEHLKSIVHEQDFNCERADNIYGADVLEDIWVAINTAEIIIADITSKNPNVFYEIGIAHTLGKKVILLTQSVPDIPFDFKRFRHIIYEDNVDGFDVLKKEIPKFFEEL